MEKKTRKLSFAIIGGGHGGQGLAGYLACKGHKVNLYNRSINNIKEIAERKYVELQGEISGHGVLNIVTDDIGKAIHHVDIIMVVLPASAHREIANKLAKYLEPNQYIVLNPGRTGGALEFKNIILKQSPTKDVCIVEAQTFLFACRSLGDAKVRIFSKKNEVKVAALPAFRTAEFIEKIHNIIPEFTPMNNVLETSLNNVGAVLHPIPTILNSARIENTAGDFQYYIDGITPSVAKVVEAADYERITVAKTLGVNTISLREWLGYTYNAHGETLCEALRNTVGYWGIMAPSNLNTRYIFEDVPNSLVPISDIGRHLGLHTPTIDSMIHLASLMHNTNYYIHGRKVSDMGLIGLSIDEIIEYVMNGNQEAEGGVA